MQHLCQRFLHLGAYCILQWIVMHAMVSAYPIRCLIYAGFFLSFAADRVRSIGQLLGAFLVGLTFDVLYGSLGVHAAATVFMSYVKLSLPSSGLFGTAQGSTGGLMLHQLGYKGFSVWAIVLLAIHHTAVFVLDARGRLVGFCGWPQTLLLTYTSAWLLQRLATPTAVNT